MVADSFLIEPIVLANTSIIQADLLNDGCLNEDDALIRDSFFELIVQADINIILDDVTKNSKL